MHWYTFSSLNDDSTLLTFMKGVHKSVSKQLDPHKAKKKLYSHSTHYLRIEDKPLSEGGNFWDRNFGKSKKVTWNQFQKGFQKEFKTEISELYKSDESFQWLFNVLKNDVFDGTETVTKDKFLEVRGESKHRDHFWKVVNDRATEKYCIKEVFNMKSAVRLTAVENLGIVCVFDTDVCSYKNNCKI